MLCMQALPAEIPPGAGAGPVVPHQMPALLPQSHAHQHFEAASHATGEDTVPAQHTHLMLRMFAMTLTCRLVASGASVMPLICPLLVIRLFCTQHGLVPTVHILCSCSVGPKQLIICQASKRRACGNHTRSAAARLADRRQTESIACAGAAAAQGDAGREVHPRQPALLLPQCTLLTRADEAAWERPGHLPHLQGCGAPLLQGSAWSLSTIFMPGPAVWWLGHCPAMLL